MQIHSEKVKFFFTIAFRFNITRGLEALLIAAMERLQPGLITCSFINSSWNISIIKKLLIKGFIINLHTPYKELIDRKQWAF